MTSVTRAEARRLPIPTAPLGQEGHRQLQARAMAAMFGAGGVLGLLAVLVPHGDSVNTAAWAVNSALGLPAAAGLFAAGRRTPVWMLHALLVIGAGMVALGTLFGHAGPAAVAASLFFVWVALYVGWFLPMRSAGIAWWRAGDGASDLLGRADAELYQAKRNSPSSNLSARGNEVATGPHAIGAQW